MNYTGIFMKFYIQGKFTEDDRNAHISVVKDILHANKSDVIAYLQQKDARLTERLMQIVTRKIPFNCYWPQCVARGCVKAPF